MTREEMSLQDAIQVLKDTNCYGTMDIAKSVILKALEQEPCVTMVEIDLYSVIKQKYIEREALDKIRAEIKHFMYNVNPSSSESDYACNYILDIIDKYKAESEG